MGSSLVFWAESRAKSNQAVGRELTRSNVTWHGQRGMEWQQLLPKMQHLLRSAPAPTWICLHLGGNDLASIPLRPLTAMAVQDVRTLHKILPNTLIIWSDVLPRMHYRGAQSDAKVEKARKTFNSAIKKHVSAMNGVCIRHPLIQWNTPLIFRPDGVHLNNKGNDIFINDLATGLNTSNKQLYRTPKI